MNIMVRYFYSAVTNSNNVLSYKNKNKNNWTLITKPTAAGNHLHQCPECTAVDCGMDETESDSSPTGSIQTHIITIIIIVTIPVLSSVNVSIPTNSLQLNVRNIYEYFHNKQLVFLKKYLQTVICFLNSFSLLLHVHKASVLSITLISDSIHY